MKKKNETINFGWFLKQKKKSIALYVTSMILENLCMVLAVFYFARFISLVTEGFYKTAALILVLATGLEISRYLLGIFTSYVFFTTMGGISLSIKEALVERSFQLTSKTFSDNAAGTFIARITKDPEEALWSMDNFVDSLAHVLTFLVTVVYIAILNFYIALVFAGSIFILVVIEQYRTKLRMKNSKLEKKANDSSTSLTNEIIRSEKDIKALNLERELKEAAYENYKSFKKAFERKHKANMILWCLRNILVVIFTAVAVFVSLVLLKNTTLSFASLMFVFINKDSLGGIIWHFGNISESIADAKVANDRMFEIFDENKYPTERFGTQQLNGVAGHIEFKNISFGYLEETEKTKEKADQKQPVLHGAAAPANKKIIHIFNNLSFKIAAGTTVAFVGKSGSGKTTILSLISKLYDADAGQVCIDGYDIQTLSKDSIRQNISLVNQFPYIFNATIRENLLMARKNATDEELTDAVTRASLAPFINSLKDGMNTKVGESGIKLSGGQRQRLAIARALLKGSKIILFDESTSSLDNETQEEIKQSINRLAGEHTVVIVAHRLSTIKNCDRIFYLEKGQVAAEGTYKELYKQNKDFEKFFQMENSEV